MTGEQWRPMVGEELRYEVSNLGRIRNAKTGRLRKLQRQRSGHLMISFWGPGGLGERERRVRAVHRAVLEAFEGPCPAGQEACHSDGDPSNNAFSNLRWDTRRGNAADRLAHGRDANAVKARCKRGHAFTPDNTYRPRTPGGAKRQCRTCHRENEARYRAEGRRS